MAPASNRNTFLSFRVDFRLEEEASGITCQLPVLRQLWVVIEEDTSLPYTSNVTVTTPGRGCPAK